MSKLSEALLILEGSIAAKVSLLNEGIAALGERERKMVEESSERIPKYMHGSDFNHGPQGSLPELTYNLLNCAVEWTVRSETGQSLDFFQLLSKDSDCWNYLVFRHGSFRVAKCRNKFSKESTVAFNSLESVYDEDGSLIAVHVFFDAEGKERLSYKVSLPTPWEAETEGPVPADIPLVLPADSLFGVVVERQMDLIKTAQMIAASLSNDRKIPN